jgi:hypothetical protein
MGAGIASWKLTTIIDIRFALAKKHKATISCPMTTGIFAWIAAYAADERKQRGEKKITPYWRTLKSGGLLNEKYPGGIKAHRLFLEKEGHTIVAKGEKFLVLNYEESLIHM